MSEIERRLTEVERRTQNGYSPVVLALRLDNLDRKVDDLDKKVDTRFDKLTGGMWRIAGFVVGAMGVAVAIVSVVIR